MWDKILPHAGCSWEPLELRILKKELANLACKCSSCVSPKDSSLNHQASQAEQIEIDESTQSERDEAVQVEQKNYLLDRYIYATSDIPPDADDQRLNLMDCLRKDVFCPNCYLIWDLLRRTTKVFKDAESEIRPELSDKCTEKAVNYSDCATSAVTKTLALNLSSNLTLCDFISDSSDSSLNNHRKKKNSHDKVKFSDENSVVEIKKEPQVSTLQGNCFCLENYMETIRPPLKMIYE